MTKLAFPTDEHFPFQDEHARSVALQIVADFQPDVRIAGSDGLDFYTLSKFDKDPHRIKNLQWEIDEWKRGQREWKSAAPEAGAFYLIGNHEERLKRYLWRHPELYDLDALKLPVLLGMAELDIYWEKEKGEDANLELPIHNKLVVKHGSVVRKNSAYSARGELESEKYSISVMSGHTHRGGMTYATTRFGVVSATECFCLCDLRPGYVNNPDWQHGIVLATASPQSLAIEPIPFFRQNGKVKAIWRGKEYVE